MNDRRRVLELFEQNKDFVDERVTEGIEKYRKGDAKIILTDSEGAPLNNAKIKINQKNHAFRFGANIFMLDQMETE